MSPESDLHAFAFYVLWAIGLEVARFRFLYDSSRILLEMEQAGVMRLKAEVPDEHGGWDLFRGALAPFIQRDSLSERFGAQFYLLVLLSTRQVLLFCNFGSDSLTIRSVLDPEASIEAKEFIYVLAHGDEPENK